MTTTHTNDAMADALVTQYGGSGGLGDRMAQHRAEFPEAWGSAAYLWYKNQGMSGTTLADVMNEYWGLGGWLVSAFRAATVGWQTGVPFLQAEHNGDGNAMFVLSIFT